MFGLFKVKKKQEVGPAPIRDINGMPVAVGSRVKMLRYDLGECLVALEGREYFYVSEQTGRKVSFTKMFDAVTQNQKVEVIS